MGSDFIRIPTGFSCQFIRAIFPLHILILDGIGWSTYFIFKNFLLEKRFFSSFLARPLTTSFFSFLFRSYFSKNSCISLFKSVSSTAKKRYSLLGFESTINSFSRVVTPLIPSYTSTFVFSFEIFCFSNNRGTNFSNSFSFSLNSLRINLGLAAWYNLIFPSKE